MSKEICKEGQHYFLRDGEYWKCRKCSLTSARDNTFGEEKMKDSNDFEPLEIYRKAGRLQLTDLLFFILTVLLDFAFVLVIGWIFLQCYKICLWFIGGI
jgi:hypothetical protein